MSTSTHVTIIAEAGVNHNGDLRRALAMVDAAAEAGADAVKFQTFRPEALVTAGAPQAEYQRRNDGDRGSQLAMLRRLALPEADHPALVRRCRARGIRFLSSPFDPASADFLMHDLGLEVIKLGSGELTNGPLIHRVARAGRRLILSTGMATLDEIREALAVAALGYLGRPVPSGRAGRLAVMEEERATTALEARVQLLHCTTEYPCPPEAVNLRAMETLAGAFGLPVGYSDHTEGITVAVAAAARGARIIEKHFTLDRTLPGPDHAASLEPDQLRAMVEAVRIVERALGGRDKAPVAVERENMAAARKSLVAACAIRAGEPFSESNLAVKRPGTGRSPMDYWSLLGRPAPRDYAADEVIQ
ncbi:MAG: N-acetylneuraminate synthase [Gammaproteobacteria bacterium]|nr:MAG: N-acetylneuraminate synthase [Gammaproteobacteria bacterium]